MRNKLSKILLEELYMSGSSMPEIAKKLNCSIHKVVYWMDKYEVKRRSWSDATYLKRNPTGDPFTIKEKLDSNDQYLLGLALGIYWGEGEKTSPNAIRVSNTDPYLLRTFITFLLSICQLEERKLLYSIVCFNDSSISEAKKYWARMLHISEDKFGKIVQIPPQGKGTYRQKSQFGVCTVVVSNNKLKKWIMDQIRVIKENA